MLCSCAGSKASSDSNELPKTTDMNGTALKSAVNGLKAEAQADSGADSTDGWVACRRQHVDPDYETVCEQPLRTLSCLTSEGIVASGVHGSRCC